MKRAHMTLTDVRGGVWEQEFTVVSPPWIFQTNGYTAGGWKDGGSIHTYHGSCGPTVEWDEFDFSVQPFRYVPYGNSPFAVPDTFNVGVDSNNRSVGIEYLTAVQTTAPDGSKSHGEAQFEHFISGPYRPYGF